jgi:hypothetical protein
LVLSVVKQSIPPSQTEDIEQEVDLPESVEPCRLSCKLINSIIRLGTYLTLKCVEYVVIPNNEFYNKQNIPKHIIPILRNGNIVFNLITSIFVIFSLCFASLFSLETISHSIDKTNSYQMWKWYIRLLCYGLIFIAFMAMVHFFLYKGFNGAIL